MNRRRVLALSLALLAGLALLLSWGLMIHEADHRCPGEDCPVCRFLCEMRENHRRMGALTALAMLGVIASLLDGFHILSSIFYRKARVSPVALRVRLNN